MAIFKATDKDDTLRATNAADIVYGLLGRDTLHGLGGDDDIQGGDGDDIINGDGAYTVADSVRETGGAVIPVAAAKAIVFTSMGLTTSIDGAQASVWRVRNATNTDQVVTVTVPGTTIAYKIFAKALSDTLFTSGNLTGTHVMTSTFGSSPKAAGTQTFAHEQAYGTTVDGNDALDGGAGNDTLSGQGGNDILTGGEGADILDGGAGKDRADYRLSKEGVTVHLEKGGGWGGDAEGDVLRAIENVSGSSADDALYGDKQVNRLVGRQGNDVLYGGAGNDVLIGGSGADHHDGGEGIDTVNFTSSWGGVMINLLKGVGEGAEAKGDTFTGIENVIGSKFEDSISGDDSANRLNGGEGSDFLAGNGGNDVLIGGAGGDKMDGGEGERDAADYATSEKGVGVDLLKGGFGGDAEGDSFTGIEFVYGSKLEDVIFGDDSVNRLAGNGGDDFLSGRGGNDYLVGGAGDDKLEGGKGADVFVFNTPKFGADTILDFETGAGRTDRVWLTGQGVTSFDEVMKYMSDTDGGAMLTLDGGTILFQGIAASSFVADDFIF